MANILVTIETDLGEGIKWIGNELVKGAAALEKLLLPIVEGIAPTLVSDIQTDIVTFLDDLSTSDSTTFDGAVEDIEQAFVEFLETTGSKLVADVVSLKGPLLQVLILAAKAAL